MMKKIESVSLASGLLSEVAIYGALGGLVGTGIGAIYSAVVQFQTRKERIHCAKRMEDCASNIRTGAVFGFGVGVAFQLLGYYAVYKPVKDLASCALGNSCTSAEWLVSLAPPAIASLVVVAACCYSKARQEASKHA